MNEVVGLRKYVILMLFLIILVSVTVTGTENSVNVMTLSGNTGLAMVKMMDQPDRSNVTYKFQVFKSPDLLLGKIISGEADIAALPTNTAAILYNKGVNIQVTSIIGWGVMYVVGTDTTIHRWKDLKGKEIQVVAKGAVPDILFQYLLTKNNIKPQTDMKLNYLASPAELAQLVAAGKVSLAVLPEPWVTEVLERAPQVKVLLDFQKEWGRVEKKGNHYPQSCIVVSRRFAQEQPEKLEQFLKDLKASMQWVEKYPDQGGILAEKFVQLSSISVEKGLTRSNLKYDDAYRVRDKVQHFLNALSQIAPEAIGGKLPNEGFYYQK